MIINFKQYMTHKNNIHDFYKLLYNLTIQKKNLL